MKRMQLQELIKNSAAFAGVSAVAVDCALLFADRAGLLSVPGEWYVNGPLAAWSLIGIPVSIGLAGRILEQAKARPDSHISAALEGAPAPNLSKIPMMANGRAGHLFASSARSIFGRDDLKGPGGSEPGETYHPAVWRVTIDGVPFVIRESELRAFLDAAAKRHKYQFSRRYWTEQRRPPLFRGKYDALMMLLTRAGLVEGRHEQGRASGYLVTHPRHAVTFLKYESPFRAA